MNPSDEKRSARRPEGPAHARKGSLAQTLKRTFTEFKEDALTDRAAATAVVQRLHAKGYPAFLVSPQTGAPVQNYKVQVGKFDDRAEAEQIAGRLKKEEQFQPWILR